jgi:ankyrin repeat protein
MAGADVNAQDSVTGYTPLHVALLRIRYQSPPKPENLSMFNLLLSNGADSSIVAYDGTTALDIDEHQVTRRISD